MILNSSLLEMGHIKNRWRKYKRRGLNNTFLFPLQPIDLISSAYSLGDLELVSLEKYITKIALPSKIGQILAAGSPILGMFDADSYIAREIHKNNIGVVVDNFKVNSLVEIILYYYRNRDELKMMSENARLYAIQHLNRRTQTKMYNLALKSIIESN